MSEEEARLFVFRAEGRYALLRALRVLLDGNEIGSVKKGDVRSFPIPPGRHSITVKMDWVESVPVTFDCAPGDRLDVRCSPPTFTWRERLMTPMKQASKPFQVEVSPQEG